MQGSVLRNPSSLSCYIVQQPISGAHCEQFVIRNKNGTNIWVSPIHPAQTTTVSLPVPSTDDFYYVHFVFAHDPNTNTVSDVLTSPIFIDR